MDDYLLRWSGFAGIAVLIWLVVSPKVHLGLIATVGLSMICLGVLGIELQYQEMGNAPSFGVTGQWIAIKSGLIVAAVGLGWKALQTLRGHTPRKRYRDLRDSELHKIIGRGKE